MNRRVHYHHFRERDLSVRHASVGWLARTQPVRLGHRVLRPALSKHSPIHELRTRHPFGGAAHPFGSALFEPRMNANDVGRAVVYIANVPLDTNVLFLTVMANLMPFVGRG
jgi:hypothetical protein